jgi:hypothetical protein
MKWGLIWIKARPVAIWPLKAMRLSQAKRRRLFWVGIIILLCLGVVLLIGEWLAR